MSAHPVRLQLSRKKGFNLQALSRATNGLPAKKVDRSTKHGNPFRVGLVACNCRSAGEYGHNTFRRETARQAVDDYAAIPRSSQEIVEIQRELGGFNLADWCGLDQPCHADVLLELANV